MQYSFHNTNYRIGMQSFFIKRYVDLKVWEILSLCIPFELIIKIKQLGWFDSY